MKAVLQRVTHASVTVDGECLSRIGGGLLILLGVVEGDTERDLDWMVRKCVNMRIFNDDSGVMNRSVLDTGGDVLVVSQFTLAASIAKGNRPSYVRAAGHELAVPMYEAFCDRVSALLGRPVGRGRFGADMKVELLNDGPVTITADSAADDMTLRRAQGMVDEWIRGVGNGYFSELTNMALLTEEVGELARVVARTYGDQVAKEGDLRHSLADELADVLWVTLCLANQTGVDLAAALRQSLRKKTERDHSRFKP